MTDPAQLWHYAAQAAIREHAPDLWVNLMERYRAGNVDGRAAVAAVSIPSVLCSLDDSPARPHNQILAEMMRLVEEHVPALYALMREQYRRGQIDGARALAFIEIENVVCGLNRPEEDVRLSPAAMIEYCEDCGGPITYEAPFVHACTGKRSWETSASLSRPGRDEGL